MMRTIILQGVVMVESVIDYCSQPDGPIIEGLPDPVDTFEVWSIFRAIETTERKLADKGCFHDYDYKFVDRCATRLLDYVNGAEGAEFDDEVLYGLLILAKFSNGQAVGSQASYLNDREINLRSKDSFVSICNSIFTPWEWEFGIARHRVMDKIDDLMGVRDRLSNVLKFSKKGVDNVMSGSLFKIPPKKEGVSGTEDLCDLYEDLESFVRMNSLSMYGLVVDRWVAQNVTHDSNRLGELSDRTDTATIMKVVEAIYQAFLIRDMIAGKLSIPVERSTVDYTMFSCQGVLFYGGQDHVDCFQVDGDDAFGEW